MAVLRGSGLVRPGPPGVVVGIDEGAALVGGRAEPVQRPRLLGQPQRAKARGVPAGISWGWPDPLAAVAIQPHGWAGGRPAGRAAANDTHTRASRVGAAAAASSRRGVARGSPAQTLSDAHRAGGGRRRAGCCRHAAPA